MVCGSSPLAWGILPIAPTMLSDETVHPHSRGVYVTLVQYVTPFVRFIPTRVGYTSRWTTIVYPESAVHPHSRGVYAIGSQTTSINASVHPHSRGVYVLHRSLPDIPAVHPHSRGVYMTGGWMLAISNRFIPTRVGYTLLAAKQPPSIQRFIPTRVGYTAAVRRNEASPSGSSPLAWGIRQYALAISP